MKPFFRTRPGVTLIELLLFVGILAMSMGAILAFFLLTTESRVRQQVANDVEQNAIQLEQFFENEVRHAERIIDPPLGETGSILTLESSDVGANPVIVAVQSGYVLLVRGDAEYVLSPPEVTVSDLQVFNASTSDNRQGVLLTYTVSRILPLAKSGYYRRNVTQGISVLQDDSRTGNPCNCAAPACDDGLYKWKICSDMLCTETSGSIACDE